MGRVKRGGEALGSGWGVLWRNGQLLLLVAFAIIATFGALGALLALARSGADGNLAISIEVGSLIALVAILGVWCYAAAFRAVADDLDTGTVSIVSALQATFGRIHAVALWGIVTALVHGVLAGSATIGVPHSPGRGRCLGSSGTPRRWSSCRP